ATVNPLVWGEGTWMWPAMRMDIMSRVSLGDVGDVDTTDAFSAGGWFMLRQKTGGSGTGNGALFARMGVTGGRKRGGWEIYQRDLNIIVGLTDDAPGCGIQVVTKERIPRYEWQHLFFTYDGSGKASGLTVYLNGKP